jgi:hypothetical protein
MHSLLKTLPADNTSLRRALYGGAVFLLPATPAARELTGAAAGLLEAEFAGVAHPREAQHVLSTEEFLRRVGNVRKALAGGPRFRDLARRLLAECGFDPGENAVDVVRLRAVTHKGHESPAARPAYSAHRDTWYANPRAQVNWWLPLHDVTEEETFALYPDDFARAVANSSAAFDYDEWVRAVGWQNPRASPDALYPSALDPPDPRRALRFAAGAAQVLLFSGAHLHQTLPNSSGRTRFSVDFRTTHLGDHARGEGAPDADNGSRGCALKGYLHPPGGRA